MVSFQPLEDMVLLEKISDEEKPFATVGGRIKTVTGGIQIEFDWAKVAAQGRGTLLPGVGVVANEINVGDVVIYAPRAVGHEFRQDGKAYMVIPYKSVFGKAKYE